MLKDDELVKVEKAVFARGPSFVIASQRRSNLVLNTRDKLRNLAICNCLKNRDCRVAPLLAMTAWGVLWSTALITPGRLILSLMAIACKGAITAFWLDLHFHGSYNQYR